MNCDRIGMLLERRWDGPLTEMEERMVQDHLSRCAACREEEEAIRLADDEMGAGVDVVHVIITR